MNSSIFNSGAISCYSLPREILRCPRANFNARQRDADMSESPSTDEHEMKDQICQRSFVSGEARNHRL